MLVPSTPKSLIARLTVLTRNRPLKTVRAEHEGKEGVEAEAKLKGKRAKGHSSSNNRSPPSNHPDRVCSHPTCLSQIAHTVEHCWTRNREEHEDAAGALSGGGKAKKEKRTPGSYEEDDSE